MQGRTGSKRYNQTMSALRRPFSFRRLLLSTLLLWFASLGGAWAATAPVLLIVGDSISAGYGLANGKGWVTLLTQRLADAKSPFQVVNASISGDTTAGGLARLPALLGQHKPAVVVIELGGNDALRGGDLNATRANLDAMIAEAKRAHARVLLLGMQLPPNYGTAYVKRFGAVFTDAAAANKVPVVPYLFDGFGEDLDQFQPDRIHPTAAAQPKILDNVWPALAPLLKQAEK